MNTTSFCGNLFEQSWWLDLVAEGRWKEICAYDKNENILARFAFVSEKKSIYMPPYTQTLGIWFSEECKHDSSLQKNAIYQIFNQLKGFDSIKIFLNCNNTYVLPFRWLGYSMEPYFTYRFEDLTDLDLLYKNMGKTAKKNIKSASKKVNLNDSADFSHLWNLLNQTYESQHRKNPMDEEIVRKIFDSCINNGHGKYLEAVDNEGHVHSCAFFVYDESVCYYLFGGSDRTYSSSGAQSLIIWEGIKFASEHSRVFDFEGSMVEGIEHFFRGFGCTQKVYYCVKKQRMIRDIFDVIKPRVKQLIGYKI